MAEEKNKWISMKDYTFGKIVTHEIECPYCGHKETYNNKFGEAPRTCYVCGRILEK